MIRYVRNRFLLVCVLILGSCASYAADGTELLKNCQDAEQFDSQRPTKNAYGIGMCLGLLEGVAGAMELMDASLPAPMRTCFPEQRLAALQAVRIVVKYLRENPEKHHEPAAYLTALAFGRAFRCRP
jgi:hypothetical protein